MTTTAQTAHVSDLRHRISSEPEQPDPVCEVPYRPPLDWPSLLRFLGARAAVGVEWTGGTRYLRTARIGMHLGWLSVEPYATQPLLRVQLSASLAPVLPQVVPFVARLFDLSADPAPVAAHLGALAESHPGLRVPGAFSGFEVAVRAILGQQVSVHAATVMMGRFVSVFGEPVESPLACLNLLTPTPDRVAEATPDDVARLRIVRARAASIVALAREVAACRIVLEPGIDVGETLAALRRLPGVGEWTAQYIAMRALGWPDAFPHTDLGIRRALGEDDPRQILSIAEQWRPFKAYAAMHLWKSLENKE